MSIENAAKLLFDEYLKFLNFIGKRSSATYDYDCSYDAAFSAASQALVDSGININDINDYGDIAKITGRIPMSWLNLPGKITIFIKRYEEGGVNILVGTEISQITDYGEHEKLIDEVFARIENNL